jgi:hypothetical protein
MPELRSYAREHSADEAPAATSGEPTAEPTTHDAPADGVPEGEAVVHAGEPPVQYPWDTRP